MSAPPAAPLLSVAGIEKAFPGVLALRDGRLELRAGEVHALLGENGAGKSTLLKILAGIYRPDAGEIRLDGLPVTIASPADARRQGIVVIHQEFNLAPDLSVRENLFLGRERTRRGWLRAADERQATRAILQRLGASFDPETRCGDLTVAQQQMTEIARALLEEARILVMDEPTAALSGRETEALFAAVRDLKARGIGIVYVSHRLDEIFALCDRATVLRDGAHIATHPIAAWSRPALIEAMVGRPLEAEFPQRTPQIGEVVLEARDLARPPAVRGVSFAVRAGEIVGLTGLVGAGRTEVVRLLFGADRAERGEILIDGKTIRPRSPQEAIASGICLLTEDRKRQGLVLDLSIRENVSLPNLLRFTRAGLLQSRPERDAVRQAIASLSIRTPHAEQPARFLSGGNQQKVVLAKWLPTDARVFLFDEPTRGVDVGAKFEIYRLMHELASRGKAIVMISSELPEVLGMSDRVLVMREGRIAGEIADVAGATQERLLSLALSG